MKSLKGPYIFLCASLLFFVFALNAAGYTNKTTRAVDVLSAVNEVRTHAGLPTLTHNKELARAAEQKADDMIARGYFTHYTPDGNSPWVFIADNDYEYLSAGENLALNFFDTKSLTDAWLASELHQRNLLNPLYTETGVAVKTINAKEKTRTVIVQYFARPK